MHLQEAIRLAKENNFLLTSNGDGTMTLEDLLGCTLNEELHERQIAEMKAEDFIDFYLS